MPNQNCALQNNRDSEACALGCRDVKCCEVTKGGENAHHCLSQLLKRIGREPLITDTCGGCKTRLKEKDGD